MMKAAGFLILMLVVAVQADMYLHNPPGSNDRNRERNDNRANGNRLFDSQNNGKGGYPYRGRADVVGGPDPITLYTGSTLHMEWTNQHACGQNPNDHCTVVIQGGHDTIVGWANRAAARAPGTATMIGMRDGYPEGAVDANSDNNNAGYTIARFTGEGGQNSQGTNTIPTGRAESFYTQGTNGGGEFGMHEHNNCYTECTTTERNRGLYNADQTLKRSDMRATRQNPNGARRGLECPSERDYYPFFHGGCLQDNWWDIAVLVDNTDRCDYYRQNSANVRGYGRCVGATGNLKPSQSEKCLSLGGTWVQDPAKGIDAPECKLSMMSRDNHLGNAVVTDNNGNPVADSVQGENPSYDWTVPDMLADKHVVLRIRYNISTGDFQSPNYNNGTPGIDFTYNCPRVELKDNVDVDDLEATVNSNVCTNLITVASRPRFNRPYVPIFAGLGAEYRLSIALNTNQASRTFQDRSYLIAVRAKPNYIPDGTAIWNMNVRGRRGNIVQAYPAVEYDFVPSRLQVPRAAYVHIQFWGSDFNAAKNANNGEGWQYSDRSNLCEMIVAEHNFPAPYSSLSLFNEGVARRWCLLDQENCKAYKNGDANEQNSIDNCGKMNRAPARFPLDPAQGIMQVGASTGVYNFVSTRNNNFSNRSHKGQFIISDDITLTPSEVAGIAVGVSLGIAGAVLAICFIGYKKRNTVAGNWYVKSSQKCAPICGPICGRCTGFCATSAQQEGFKQTTSGTKMAAPDLQYTRH